MAARYRSSAYEAAVDPRRRAASTFAAVAIAALIIWAFLTISGRMPPRFGNGRTLTTFDVTQQGASTRKATRATVQKQQQRAERQERAADEAPPRTAPPPPLP